MKLRKIIVCALAAAVMPVLPGVYAAGLFSGTYTEESFKVDAENGVTFEMEVPDGDYSVTVKTGGETETEANVFINGGERVRVYTLEAGQTQDNEQRVVPQDGRITVQVLGANPNVTEIDIEQLPDRTEPGEKPTIYIAGDSTAQTYNYASAFPQTGWGQVFGDFFTDDVVVENRAIAGRSAKSFNNDGRLDNILTEMHPGDYVFIQFGINDGAADKPERYISVEDYKELITGKYIGEVKKRGGIPVLLTPTAASWWDEENNCFMESRQDYAVPTKEIAEETGAAFIDINAVMTESWNSKYDLWGTQEAVFDLYFICEPLESKAYPAGTDDHTHLKAAGAEKVAGMIVDRLEYSVPGLAAYVKPETEFTDISGHWAESVIKNAKAQGLLDGFGDGSFQPESAVTRAEFLKMAMDAAGIVPHAYRDGECLDAENDDWYCYYLQGALDKDLIPESMIEDCAKEAVTKVLAEASETAEAVTADINVYTGGFNGDMPIKREEMAAIAMNCFVQSVTETVREGLLSALDEQEPYEFGDADMISAQYADIIAAARSVGLVEGDDDNMFIPLGNLTRAEAAAVSYRMNMMKLVFNHISAEEKEGDNIG